MAITFPTSLDSLVNPATTNTLNSPSHAGQHSDANDAIEALEAKVGVNGSAVNTSLDFLVKNTTSGHDHDGSDSKKVLVTNLDVTGLTNSQLIRRNSGGTALESAGVTLADLVDIASVQTITGKKTFSTADLNLATGRNIQVNDVDPIRGMYVPATAMFAATTNGAAGGQIETSSNKVNAKCFDFDQSTEEYVAMVMPSPSMWDAGTLTIQFIWTAASGSGDVIWAAQAIAFSNDDALDTAYGTAVTTTDTLITANDDHHTSFTSAMTVAGTPTAGDLVAFRFYRDADAGGDTLNADARLIAVKIRFTIGQYDDQ